MADPSNYGALIADRDGLMRLAGLFALAARSRYTIIHIPLKQGPPLPGASAERFIQLCGGRVDLVLLHRSLRFPTSHWPALRSCLGSGSPLTVDTDVHHWTEPQFDFSHLERPDFRDYLWPQVYAETLFLIGSRDGFRNAIGALIDTATLGPCVASADTGEFVVVSTLTPNLGLSQASPAQRRTQIDLHYLDTSAIR